MHKPEPTGFPLRPPSAAPPSSVWAVGSAPAHCTRFAGAGNAAVDAAALFGRADRPRGGSGRKEKREKRKHRCALWKRMGQDMGGEPPVPHPFEGSLATARARRKLWVYPGPLPVMIATIKRPPGKNRTYPDPSGISWQPQKRPRKTGLVLATERFYDGSIGCFGEVHLGMVHRRSTTNSRHGADAVHARCRPPPPPPATGRRQQRVSPFGARSRSRRALWASFGDSGGSTAGEWAPESGGVVWARGSLDRPL